jgi:hypothetical protein
MNLKALALGAAVAALACGPTHAAIITYEMTGTATWLLDGTPQTGSFDLTAIGDPSKVVTTPYSGAMMLEQNGGVATSPLSMSIWLAGVSYDLTSSKSYVYNITHDSLAGFGGSAGDFLVIRSALLDNYDMVSALAAVTGTWVATSHGVQTMGGHQLSFSTVSNIQFSAHLAAGSLTPPAPASAAPEPTTWALMLTGFGGLGAALRTRRRRAFA